MNQLDYFYVAVGFAVALVAGLIATSVFNVGVAWPKVARLALILSAASVTGYVFGRLGVRLFYGFLFTLAAIIAVGLASAIWHYA